MGPASHTRYETDHPFRLGIGSRDLEAEARNLLYEFVLGGVVDVRARDPRKASAMTFSFGATGPIKFRPDSAHADAGPQALTAWIDRLGERPTGRPT
ncbi:MAG: hypothetical protein JWN02_1681 [Acidobacteria bacterium]|nr:hypothetical protein [Acidobacteriota bacterium]